MGMIDDVKNADIHGVAENLVNIGEDFAQSKTGINSENVADIAEDVYEGDFAGAKETVCESLVSKIAGKIAGLLGTDAGVDGGNLIDFAEDTYDALKNVDPNTSYAVADDAGDLVDDLLPSIKLQDSPAGDDKPTKPRVPEE